MIYICQPSQDSLPTNTLKNKVIITFPTSTEDGITSTESIPDCSPVATSMDLPPRVLSACVRGLRTQHHPKNRVLAAGWLELSPKTYLEVHTYVVDLRLEARPRLDYAPSALPDRNLSHMRLYRHAQMQVRILIITWRCDHSAALTV